MTSHAITKQDTTALIRGEQRFLPLRIPKFKFEQERWATSRTENVEKIAEAWQSNPNLVRIFQDPKFGHMQMAMLRKDQLESLIKILRDVEHGQAAVQFDVRALFDAVGIVQDLVEAKRKSLPADLEKPLSKAVNLFVNLWGKVSSTIFVQAPKRQVNPSPLSEEEKQLLED
jgi:hypothetical protein